MTSGWQLAASKPNRSHTEQRVLATMTETLAAKAEMDGTGSTVQMIDDDLLLDDLLGDDGSTNGGDDDDDEKKEWKWLDWMRDCRF